MKIGIGTLLIVGLLFFPSLAVTFTGGPPSGRSGAPGELTCQVQCHNSFDVNAGAGTFAITGPESYAPGDTLELTVVFDATDRSKHGFQLAVKDAAGADVGELILLDDSTRTAEGSANHVTHNAAGTAKQQWIVGWTTNEDVGTVTFYAAGVAANGADGNKNDFVYTTELALGSIAVDAEVPLPQTIATLESNFPNPVATHTTFRYALDEPTPVRLAVYDVSGRMVQVVDEGHRAIGTHTARFDASRLSAGVYVYELRAANFVETRSMVVQR